MLLSDEQKHLIKQGLKYIWGARSSQDGSPLLIPSEQKVVQKLLLVLVPPTTQVYVELGDARHVIELKEQKFVVQHVLACRPDLFDCTFNAAAGQFDGVEQGKYYCDVVDGKLILQEPVVDD